MWCLVILEQKNYSSVDAFFVFYIQRPPQQCRTRSQSMEMSQYIFSYHSPDLPVRLLTTFLQQLYSFLLLTLLYIFKRKPEMDKNNSWQNPLTFSWCFWKVMWNSVFGYTQCILYISMMNNLICFFFIFLDI